MLAHDDFLERILWQITNLGSAHVPSTPVPYLMLFTVHAPYRFIKRHRMCLKLNRMQQTSLPCRSMAMSTPASPTQPLQHSKNALPRSRVVSARSPLLPDRPQSLLLS